jgi:predicted lipoprotein with Yx(FWY)xxD motif
MDTDSQSRPAWRQFAGQWRQQALLKLVGAGLLWASAGIHLDLYLTGYRTIPTIGWLFLFQVIVGLGLGLLVLLTPSRLIAALSALFALSTLGGYLLTVQFGLFGFKEVRTTAGIVAGICEVLAFAALAIYALTPREGLLARARSRLRDGLGRAEPAAASGRAADAGAGHRGGAGRDRIRVPTVSIPKAAALTGVVSIVALGLLAGALAASGAPGGSATAGQSASGAELRTAQIGGVTVLTNTQGRTLYWFAPDTSTKSVCNGSCAVYWPPVKGPDTAGPGVTGKLATITRADGSTEETFNGHPLYTYIGDTAAGQDHGNNLNLNGGLWHEVVVSK